MSPLVPWIRLRRNSLQEDLTKIHKRFKKTIVFVTHDMQEAINLGDRICLMNEGEIEQIGTPDEILTEPANDFVEEFLQTGLPQYQHQEEKTVQTFIDKDYVSKNIKNSETVTTTIEPTDSLHDLTIALSKTAIVKVDSDEPLFITRENLIQFYAEELETSQGGPS